jgi:hypothetical protein
MEKVFSVGSAPRLYNEDPRSAEKMSECLETAAEDGSEEAATELVGLQKCGCDKKTSGLLQLQ